MEGTLYKKSNYLKQWNMRHVVYDRKKNAVTWYKTKSGLGRPSGTATVGKVKLVADGAKNHLGNRFRFDVTADSGTLVQLAAESQNERAKWIAAFRWNAIGRYVDRRSH